MKQNRIIAFLLAAALLLSMCCSSGCAKDSADVLPSDAPTEEPTESPSDTLTEEPTESPSDAVKDPVRMRNGGTLSFLPEETISVPKLSEMVYSRPDTETLIAKIEALTEKVPGCNDAKTLVKDYYEIAQLNHRLLSALCLANFRMNLDSNDSYYWDESDFLYEQSIIVDELLTSLYASFAASSCRDALEQAYFGEGFFEDYDDINTADETVLDLKMQERDLTSQRQEKITTDLSTYDELKKDHESLGELFIQLVKVRQQLAKAQGYDGYMEYIYARKYMRDFSTAQAREFLDQIKLQLVPLMHYSEISEEFSYYFDIYGYKAQESLASAAERMGGPVWESYRFMSDHELFQVAENDGNYATYINDYEAPLLVVNQNNLLYINHEFGHYVDLFCNYGITQISVSEICSQAMEYLAIVCTDSFKEYNQTKLLRAVLSDLLIGSVLRQALYADFELQVYALAPEDLTLDKIDAIYEQCITDYGLSQLDDIRYTNMGWIAIGHFIFYPGYVIDYSVSAIAALQICRLESEEPGAGVEAFCRLVNRSKGIKFLAVLAEAGLESPFEASALEKTSEFLKKSYGLK